jgi:hypothetical protein
VDAVVGPVSRADARFDDEGYQYGVRFSDGGVASHWNGSTQRQRAEEYLARIFERYADNPRFDPSRYAVVRHRQGEPWSPVEG